MFGLVCVGIGMERLTDKIVLLIFSFVQGELLFQTLIVGTDVSGSVVVLVGRVVGNVSGSVVVLVGKAVGNASGSVVTALVGR